MDHLTMAPLTMAHRAMSHPAWTTVAGGASQSAGLGHTAGQIAHDVTTHRAGAFAAAVVVAVGAVITRRRRGAGRRPATPAGAGRSGGETLTVVILAGLAGAIVWLVAGAKQQPAVMHQAAAAPRPKVTQTTIVQHITHVTHVTRAAATHIPNGLWWVAGITVVAVLVYYLARGRNHD